MEGKQSPAPVKSGIRGTPLRINPEDIARRASHRRGGPCELHVAVSSRTFQTPFTPGQTARSDVVVKIRAIAVPPRICQRSRIRGGTAMTFSPTSKSVRAVCPGVKGFWEICSV
jgi:hypothetical protein